MNEQVVGIIAGILTAASLVPQFVKSIQEKKVDVSPVMFLLLIGGNGLWIWYGIILDSMPIIITNSFGFIMDVIMLFLRIKYGKK
ncbi:SemiSWEET family transporter [Daejeonella lutea]|uniref:MtN3 and saliva related transmembrane protein n=1 Tax=Daejeonella lutea TaxID=572036 RepID=A0A1T5ARV4_9SPHI|nr:SemiSWEET family transporter [Daejeonella lutea]SKB37781.1 MtN3 and saliva related transmembrane protein [Daejeonella lutea]